MRRLLWLLIAGLLLLPGGARFVARSRVVLPPEPTLEPVAPTTEPLPTPAELEALARTDAVAFLHACAERYRREVTGFTAVLEKQEFLDGRLGPVEVIDVAFRGRPHSVLMKWRTAPAGRADRALYVAGANDGMSLARPSGRAARFLTGGWVARDPRGSDARAAGRYTMPDFGLLKGTERTVAAWSAAQKRGTLRAEYLGARKVPEAGGATCYVLRRSCDPPEEDDIQAVEVAFDTTHWLQVANVLTAPGGRLVARYYFRDVVLNPQFPPGQFDRAELVKE